MRRTILISALVVLALIVGFSIFPGTRQPVSEATSTPGPLLGKLAPTISAKKLDGPPFTLKSDLGNVVVLNFGASWCDSCAVEAPNFSTFARYQRHHGVDVVGVAINYTIASASACAKRYGSPCPSIIDPGAVAANHYGVISPPTTFVINHHGRVAATLIAPVSDAQLNHVLARVRA